MIKINAKIYEEQSVNIINEDRISIPDFFLLALMSVQLSTALNTVPFSQTVRFLLIFHTDINLLYDCDINIPVAKCLCRSFSFPKTDFWAWNWIINCRVKRQAYPPTGIFYHNFQTYGKNIQGTPIGSPARFYNC